METIDIPFKVSERTIERLKRITAWNNKSKDEILEELVNEKFETEILDKEDEIIKIEKHLIEEYDNIYYKYAMCRRRIKILKNSDSEFYLDYDKNYFTEKELEDIYKELETINTLAKKILAIDPSYDISYKNNEDEV